MYSPISRLFQNQTLTLGLSDRDRQLFENLVKRFDLIARANNLTYWLYGGTLLGYVRWLETLFKTEGP